MTFYYIEVNMKIKLIAALLLNLTLVAVLQAEPLPPTSNNSAEFLEWQQLKYGNNAIAVGNINTSVTEVIKLKPDTAEFTITYSTEGSTPNDASNRNIAGMKQLNDYLNQLGIKKDDLTTVAYQNYQNEQPQPLSDQAKQYSSTFTINININNNQFLDVVKLLDENNINDIKQDHYNSYYVFNITAIGDSANNAKQQAQAKYQQIANALNKLGQNVISIAAYDNQLISPQTELVKKYYVLNTLKIKVTNFDVLGKIISKAQELKMIVNNDMNYTVSEAEQDRILAQYQQTIYQKLAAKATRLLGQQYQLGVATNLNSNENSNLYNIQPRNYSYNKRMFNTAQIQNFVADDVDIQSPSEFTISLTMSGNFEIVKTIAH